MTEYRRWPHDSRYLVGDDGSVIGVHGSPRALTAHPSGYVTVTLGHRDAPRRVHIMVCETFNGPKPDGMEVAHENGVRTDNRASNLSWKTRIDNHADKRRHGTVSHDGRVGVDNGRARLTEADVRGIRAAALDGGTHRGLARAYGVHRRTIFDIVTGRTWTHILAATDPERIAA